MDNSKNIHLSTGSPFHFIASPPSGGLGQIRSVLGAVKVEALTGHLSGQPPTLVTCPIAIYLLQSVFVVYPAAFNPAFAGCVMSPPALLPCWLKGNLRLKTVAVSNGNLRAFSGGKSNGKVLTLRCASASNPAQVLIFTLRGTGIGKVWPKVQRVPQQPFYTR